MKARNETCFGRLYEEKFFISHEFGMESMKRCVIMQIIIVTGRPWKMVSRLRKERTDGKKTN